MSMLHTVNKSPSERNTLSSCLRLAAKGSSVLLIEDGVIGAVKGAAQSDMVSNAMSNVTLYVLGADLKARGISEERLIEGISVIDYAGFVDLAAKHDSNQAWL